MTFRKRTARGKTLLQKSFPPGPPFRKLPYVCGEAMSQREIGLAAHKRHENNIIGVLCGGPGGGFLARKSPPDSLRSKRNNPFRKEIGLLRFRNNYWSSLDLEAA